MCDSLHHTHTKIEEWITPINSRHLSSKMVHLFPGDHVHFHSTGAGREEIIVCLFGKIVVQFDKSAKELSSGETCFIAENTNHAISNDTTDTPAQYVYCVTKKTPVHLDPLPRYDNLAACRSQSIRS